MIIKWSKQIYQISLKFGVQYSSLITKKQYNQFNKYNNKSNANSIKQQLMHSEQLGRLNLIDFSVKVHSQLVKKESKLNWTQIEYQLMQRMIVTTNKQRIRSYAKILYCISKSKHMPSINYQSKVSLLLPFASKQSFTQMIVALSRMGPYSQQFTHIVSKLYYNRKQQLNIRQKLSICYALVRNGEQPDKSLENEFEKMNCQQILLLLKSYDRSNKITKQVLKLVLHHLILRKKQINVLDLTNIIQIYFKNQFVNEQLMELIEYNYHILKKNINSISLQQIWLYCPKNINQGKLSIKFVQLVIRSIKVLRRKNQIPNKIWNNIKTSFTQITNLQIKHQLELIG